MRKKNRLRGVIILAFIFLGLISPTNIVQADNWYEDELGFYTLFDEAGRELTTMAGEMFKNDEYISSDNRHYILSRVDKKDKRAYGKYMGEIELPAFEEVEEPAVETLAPEGKDRSILLYCTHSDESYVPSDGVPSIPSKGGIYDVAESLKKSLEEKGAKTVLDKTPHDPHDAGAYRRSRKTAIDLIRKNMPIAAVFDIHRDATPKQAYDTEVNGEYMSKVRMVLGKKNQNREANQELAYRIKAVADKSHPGLIKDIYIGRGEYNQELSPRSLLLEFGTHEISKEAAQKSAQNMADVISTAIYGGVFKEQKQTPPPKEGKKPSASPKPKGKDKTFKVQPIRETKTKGGSRGIVWILIVSIVVIIGFTLISKSKNEMKESFSGIFGKRKKE